MSGMWLYPYFLLFLSFMGMTSNMASIFVFAKQRFRRSFHRLLVILAIYDFMVRFFRSLTHNFVKETVLHLVYTTYIFIRATKSLHKHCSHFRTFCHCCFQQICAPLKNLLRWIHIFCLLTTELCYLFDPCSKSFGPIEGYFITNW